jgi:hypothetical protein
MATQVVAIDTTTVPSQKSQSAPSSLSSILCVSAAVFAATLLPLLLYLGRCSPFAEASVFQPDAFYYLTVARNSLHTSFYSFDGVHPTNGFHPVWEYLLYQAMRMNLLRPDNPFVTLHRLYIGNLLILSVAWAMLAAFCSRHLHRNWLAFITTCPGFLWFVVALTAPSGLSNWSYLNGMESSVELLFLGLALASFSTDRAAALRLPLSMFFFGMMVLSRLDDVFLLLPVLILVWRLHSGGPRRRVVAAVALPLAMIAAYLVYNRLSVGVFMPTSGSVKAGLAIPQNLMDALGLVIAERWSQVMGDANYSAVFIRVLQMLAPMFLCGIYLVRRDRTRWGVVEALCVGVVLKGAYNFVNVKTFHQGPWYFGSSIFMANLVIALLWDRTLNLAQAGGSKASPLRPWTAALACGVLTTVCFNIYTNHLISEGGGTWQNSILRQSDTLRAMVQHEGSDRFIDMSDGELAYATGMQTMSGQGLVLDPPAARALAHGHLFDIASERNYYLMMASGLYKDQIDALLQKRKKGNREGIYTISGMEFDEFSVTSVAYDPISDTRLYRIGRSPLR